MNTYLLLRNNKESGPLTLAELTRIGLKPYDLVWVNGRSAAWRYPSEIEELKPFAPVTEEQPYDRFYKKTEPESPTIASPQSPSAVAPQSSQPITHTIAEIPLTQPKEAGSPKQEAVQPAATPKKVFVSLPEHHPPPTAVPNIVHPSATSNYQPPQPSVFDQQEKIYGSYLPSQKEKDAEPVALEEKYSMPLDDIKEMYVKTLTDRKKKMARKNSFATYGKAAAVVAVILVLGAVIGYVLRPGEERTIASVPSNHPQQTIAENGNPQFVSSAYQQTDQEPVENMPVEKNKQKHPTAAEKNLPLKKTTSISQTKEEAEPTAAINTDQVPPPVVNDPVGGQRKRVIRDENAPTRDEPKSSATNKQQATGGGKQTAIENIWHDVTVKASDFKTGPIGGIRDLYLVVSNKSSYNVARVEVEVKYIGMEKTVVKTQLMVFNDLASGGQVRAEVPRSNRGMSVDISIKKINVRDFSFARSDR